VLATDQCPGMSVGIEMFSGDAELTVYGWCTVDVI